MQYKESREIFDYRLKNDDFCSSCEQLKYLSSSFLQITIQRSRCFFHSQNEIAKKFSLF